MKRDMSFRNKKNSGDNSGEGRETEGEKQRKVMRLRNLLCISVENATFGGISSCHSSVEWLVDERLPIETDKQCRLESTSHSKYSLLLSLSASIGSRLICECCFKGVQEILSLFIRHDPTSVIELQQCIVWFSVGCTFKCLKAVQDCVGS